MKLCGNFLIASALEATGEAAALAENSGVRVGPVVRMMAQTLFACSIYQGYGERVVERKFQPAGFRLRLGRKDVEAVIDEDLAVEAPVPLAGLVPDRALAAINKGGGEWDWWALTLEAAEDTGV